jgi:hypothetical protein
VCGLAGFSLNPNATVDATVLSAALALSIESRGGHATGIAHYHPHQKAVLVTKDGVTAYEFMDRIMESVSPECRAAIIHTRFGTKGSSDKNENNHPIVLPGIVGVHNGIITNDEEVTKKLELDRVAEVDSEVLFHIIRDQGVRHVAEHVHGDAAVAWMNVGQEPGRMLRPPTVNVAVLNNRPAVLAWLFHRDKGKPASTSTSEGIVFASTEAALKAVERDLGGEYRIAFPPSYDMVDGQFACLLDGSVTWQDDVPRVTRPAKTYSSDYWDRSNGGDGRLGGLITPRRGHYEGGRWVDDAPVREIGMAAIRGALSAPISSPKQTVAEEAAQLDSEIEASIIQDLRVHQANILLAQRDIAARPMFQETRPDEWLMTDENQWGDLLFYCDAIDVYACWEVDSREVILVLDTDQFYEGDSSDDLGEIVPNDLIDVVDVPLHSTWTERVMRRIGYVKARQNEIETIS